MSEMQVFQNSEFGELGVLEIEGKPWFPATACAKMLGYANPWKAINDHCKKDGLTKCEVIDNLGRTQSAKFITEGNLYRLIVHSKLPGAERFEKWVFDEVLPTIRRTGGYGNQNAVIVKLAEQMTQVASVMAQAAAAMTVTADKLTSLVDRLSSSPTPPERRAEEAKGLYYGPARCKLETFPVEIVRQVEGMMAEMQEQQNLNFSMIARFCTIHGHTISSPAVKTYFLKHFSEG